MGHYWDDEARLDDGEKFLRDYITNMGWKTKEKINKDDEEHSSDDDEDEEFLEKMDEFETKYNFRFEEEGGHAISSHARQVNDSVRVKESKRKKERDSKKERKESEKRAKLSELQRLKNLKQAEINARLKELEQVTGNKVASEIVGDLLDSEFDPALYDQQMEKMLGDDYYEQEDEEAFEPETPEVEHEVENGEENYDENEQEAAGEQNEQPSDNMWYYCDSCIRPIRPGNMGYECKECVDEVTECHNCHQNKSHEGGRHKMKKFLVGEDEMPPEDWQEVLYQIKKKRTKDIKRGKYDELFNMDYEDLIGGEIACRFKYTNVDSDSFGLSTQTILSKSDKELNGMVSLKKLHPYRKAHVMKRVRYHDKDRSRQ